MDKTYPVFNDNHDGDTLGGRIGRAREAAGLTAKETANQLGVKKETVSAWERDRSEPRTNRLYMLAGILGVSPIWLISGGGEGGPEYAASSETSSLRASLAEILRLHAETGRAIETLQRALATTATTTGQQ
jgi:HTH-type transcriptional regulator, cell division transcriptional repressor